MSSPISSALAKLDGSLQTVQSQVEFLRAGLEVNDSQLSYSLADARQNAAVVRDLIRAERSDASWDDRGTLDYLIHELEVAAHEQRNEQRRMKLLELGDEFEAGAVRHRSEARTAALNSLRQEALQELRAQAAIPEQEKELPGPDAGQWLHWACNLQEEKDADALTCLRTDFPALDHFAGEMEESYWMPGERIRRIPIQPSSPSRPAANVRRPPEAPTYSSPPPSPSDYGRSQNTVARPDTPPGGNYAAAVARAYERPSASTAVTSEVRRSEATLPQRGGLALVVEPAEVQPEIKTCEKCGATYSDEYHVCPASDLGRRAPAAVAAPTVVPRTAYPTADKSKNGGNGASSQKEAPVSTSTAAVAPAPGAVERPSAQPLAKPFDKKAKTRKQRRAEAALAPVPVPEIPRPKPEEEIAASEVEEKEPWTQKWQTLQESGADALSEGKWRSFLVAPEVLAVAALLLLVVVGSVWMVRRRHTSSSPVVTAETKAPSSIPTAPTASADAQPVTAANSAGSTSKNDVQSKPQDQNAAGKTNTNAAQPKDTTTPPVQVLSVPVEAPKTTTIAKREEPAATDAAPPSLPGAMASNMGPLVKDISANVPKLAGQKLRVSSGVAQGQLLRQVNPQYPPQARQERVEGTVVLQAVIGKDGSVRNLNIVSGPSLLTKAAMEAVKQWRYRPFALNGEPVEADTQINVNFKLGE
jgi:protein TonB